MIRFVIPAYNERDNIPNLMADLAPRALELGARVIFVDDGSKDGTAEVIEEHRDGLHLAIVRHKVNRGLGTAINSGLRAALGESRTTTPSSRSRPTTHQIWTICRRCWRSSSRATTWCLHPSTLRADGSSAWPRGGWPPPVLCPTPSAMSAACATCTPSARSIASTAPARSPCRRDLRLPAGPRAGLRGERRTAAEALQRGRNSRRGAHSQRLEPAPRVRRR